MMLWVSVVAEVCGVHPGGGRPSTECRRGQRCDSRDTDLSSKPFGHELVSHSKTWVDLDCKMKIDLLFFKDICENAFREWGKRQVLISEGGKKSQAAGVRISF